MSFYDGTTQVIVVTAGDDDYDDDGNGVGRPVITQCDTLEQVMQHLTPSFNDNAVKELLKNAQIVAILDRLGWRNVEAITDQVGRAKAEKRFYIADKPYSRYIQNLREVRLDALTKRDAEGLADEESVLLQSIRKTSLKDISRPLYKAYTAAKKKKEDTKKKREARAVKAKATLQKKKVAAAKKLLKNAGEL